MAIDLVSAGAPLLNLRGVTDVRQPAATPQTETPGMLGNLLGSEGPMTQQQKMRRDIGGLFGVDTTSPSQKLKNQLAETGVSLATSEGLIQAATFAKNLGLSGAAVEFIRLADEKRKEEEEEGRAELERTEQRQQRVGQIQFIDSSSLSDDKKTALKTTAMQGGFSTFKDLTDAMGLEEWKAVGGSSNAVVNNQTGEIKTVDKGETMSAKDLLESTVAGTFDMGDMDFKSQQTAIGEIQKLIDSGEPVTAAKVQKISNDNLRPKIDDDYEYIEVTDVDGNEILTTAPRRATDAYNEARGKAEANIAEIDGLVSRGESIMTEINQAIKDYDNGEAASGLTGYVLSKIPGTDTYDTAAIIRTIKANIGFDRLQQMRNESPTGGALGQVTERELGFLQATIAELSTSQTEEQILRNLRKVKDHYNNIIRAAEKRQQEVGDDINTMLDYQLGYIDGGYRVYSKGQALQQQAQQPGGQKDVGAQAFP